MTSKLYTCTLCGGAKCIPVYTNDSVNYVMCELCSLVSLFPHPTKEEYAAFYAAEYQKHRHSITDYEQAVAIRKKKGLKGKQRYVNELRPYLTDTTRVLEVGCGWGTTLKLIQDTYGSPVLGIEISELAARITKDYYKIPVLNQTFDNFKETYHGEPFDIIIMMHVLEHFVNPLEVLLAIRELLSESGVLYIAVPNIIKPDEPLDRYFHFEHVHYFSPLSLLRLLEKAGFKVLWNENTHEVKMVVARNSHSAQRIDTRHFKKMYAKGNILKSLKWQEKKYALLRFLKNGARAILPERLFRVVRKYTILLLKRLRVVKV